MNPMLKPFAGAAAVAALLLTAPGVATAQTSIQGMIISHEGDKLVVRNSGGDSTIVLTPDTKVQAVIGLIGARREDRSTTDLINGLAVTIDTAQNGEEIDAVKVTFNPSDLKTAQAVQAGTAQARQRIIAAQTENEKRLSEVGQFDEKAKTRVFFATGSAKISPQGQQDLCTIANQATTIPGSVMRVVGHTDSTGNAATNQRLSDQRASAVTAYLLGNCSVPPTKIMSSSGLGQYVPIDANDPTMGNAQNRRVTVFVLVSKASEGPSSIPASSSTAPTSTTTAPPSMR